MSCLDAPSRPNPLNRRWRPRKESFMNWKQASKKQLLLITSTYENCPLWLKTEARAELMRRQKGKYVRLQMRRKERAG